MQVKLTKFKISKRRGKHNRKSSPSANTIMSATTRPLMLHRAASAACAVDMEDISAVNCPCKNCRALLPDTRNKA